MPLAAVKEEITVTAEAPLVSVVSNTVATNFDADFLDEQPLPRNYYAIIASAPGRQPRLPAVQRQRDAGLRRAPRSGRTPSPSTA